MPKRMARGIELLADPTRREIVALVASGTRRPNAIAEAIALSRPATSRQLRLLVAAGLLRWTFARFDRRGRLYVIDPVMFAPIIAWLAGVDLRGHPPHRQGWWSPPVDVATDVSASSDSAQNGDGSV
jgi:DNA-binding transcriptional ArsR family regulator